jgi:hypothetical protein
MKYTDDYDAKLEIWAREGRVYPMPKIANIPHFGAKKFSSYEEFNEWKQALKDELIKAGGARWTK